MPACVSATLFSCKGENELERVSSYSMAKLSEANNESIDVVLSSA